jgi:hypothetical protein
VADEVVKKVKIPSSELSLLQFTTLIVGSPAREEIKDLYYDFRYRVISEDKNRTSAWSPIERIIIPNLKTPFPYADSARLGISKSGEPAVVTAIWSLPTDAELQALVDLRIADPENPNGITVETANYIKLYRQTTTYDVWVRWTNTVNANASSSGWTDWKYITTASSNTFSTVKPESSYNTVEVAIQIPTVTKLRDYNNNKITLYNRFATV